MAEIDWNDPVSCEGCEQMLTRARTNLEAVVASICQIVKYEITDISTTWTLEGE